WSMRLAVVLPAAYFLGCSAPHEATVAGRGGDSGSDAAAQNAPDASCVPFRAQRLSLQGGCLEDVLELDTGAFGCSGGCDDSIVTAVDADGNCYRMLGCAPPEWTNSAEGALPAQCDPLSFDVVPPVASCAADAGPKDAGSEALDAGELQPPDAGPDASCVPFRAQRLSLQGGCLEDVLELDTGAFGCSGGCDDSIVNAVDADGNCYRMLGCAPPDWTNSAEGALPAQCDPLSFDVEPPVASCAADAGPKDAGSEALDVLGRQAPSQ